MKHSKGWITQNGANFHLCYYGPEFCSEQFEEDYPSLREAVERAEDCVGHQLIVNQVSSWDWRLL